MKLNSADHSAWQGILTPREAEIAELAASGMSNKEIARELYVTEQTVKFHLSHCFFKVSARNRIELARWWWMTVEREQRAA